MAHNFVHDPSKLLQSHDRKIINTTVLSAQDCLKVSFTGLTIEVISGTAVVPALGLSGSTFSTHLVRFCVDPTNNNFHDVETRKKNLMIMTAHEIHHAGRIPTGKDWRFLGPTLWSAIVSEGLALNFEQEMESEFKMGALPPPYSEALSNEALLMAASRAIPVLNDSNFSYERQFDYMSTIVCSHNYHAWFKGVHNNPDYPRYGGYSLSYRILQDWLTAKKTQASKEVHVDPKAVLNWWEAESLCGKYGHNVQAAIKEAADRTAKPNISDTVQRRRCDSKCTHSLSNVEQRGF